MKLNKNIYKILFALIFLRVFMPLSLVEGAMNDYCVIPPFLSQSIPPNVLIVLDNSGSMCDEAYAGSYNPAQFANGQYYGYFDGSKNYRYNAPRWFETTDALTTGTVSNPVANGSFLNWATMRRVEVAKKLLIGGKGNPRSWNGSVSVKLDGETGCASSWNFQKDYDTSAGNLIYPFTGDYRFGRADGDLTITPLAGGSDTFDTYPNGDISVPGGWSEYPVSGAMVAYTKVDEVSSDGDATFIQANNVATPVILDYNYTQSKPAGIITVTVKVRAKKTFSGATRRIQGVLRIGGVNYASASSSGLGTSYSLYSFTWNNNPATLAPWDWNDIKSSGVGSITGFGVQAASAYSTSSPRMTQVYLNVSVAVPTGGPYDVIIDQGNNDAAGIIDTLTGDVRFGLAYYNSNSNGGEINTYVDFGATTSMINSIGGMNPSTWTPLGETLYEMIRYFRQDPPFYSNSPADYQTGTNYDPYWYKYTSLGTGLADRYVPCAKSFILFLTDGESTQDQNFPAALKGVSTGYRFAGTAVGTTYPSSGTDYMIDAAFWGRTNDARPGTCTAVSTSWNQCLPATQTITLYSVYMFGKGSSLLKDAAIVGGFEDLNGNQRPDCATTPAECYRDSNGNGIISSTAGVCSNDATRACTTNAGCIAPGSCSFDTPLTYYEGEDGYELQRSIMEAISAILRRVTSGTAASVLASGEGSGANLIQATYYPRRQFGNDTISWIGSLQNLWYYVDPRFSNSNIREEGGSPKDYILNLKADGVSNSQKDYILQLYFDSTEQKARARRFPDDGTGAAGSQIDIVDFEKIGNLWNAGSLLWYRNLWNVPRAIKTWLDKDNDGTVDAGEFINFDRFGYTALSAADKATLKTSLQSADDTAALKTINYTNGFDKFCTGTTDPCLFDTACTSPATCSGAGFRSRTVAFDLNGDGDVLDSGEFPKVWKLGDIINSTPQTASWMPLNTYQTVYKDSTYADFVTDAGSTLPATSTARYRNRGMVFLGANDGMLHAFKLGKLGLKWTSQGPTQKATLGKYCVDSPNTACVVTADCPTGACASDTDLGTEIWAYIPKNALPYLKYSHDPSYCHIYSVDLAPHVFDASIEGPATSCTESNYWNCEKNADSWRTIIIGGMRYGGACKETTYAGSEGVKVPVAGQGYSSYFALDITDPYNPQLLWEFSHPDLGFATSGPSIMRINSRTPSGSTSFAETGKNGKWSVILGSGPTGGIDTADHQFLGNSDQNLRLFIIDLKTGALERTIDTGVANAFAGSMLSSAQDSDLDYQNNVVYVPYVRKCASGDTAAICDSSAGKWNNGGVLRLVTNEDRDGSDVSDAGGTALNPDNWLVSRVIDDAGPVTSSVVKLQNKRTGKLWIYFGTGRYFYKTTSMIDDSDKARNLYGLKDPCFDGTDFIDSCLTSYTPSQLANVDLTTTLGVTDDEGWKIALDGCTDTIGTPVACTSSYFRTERVITNPLATTQGIVFFTTLKPYDDICSTGGNSAIWAVKYDTGGAAGNLLQGKALIQVSTGAIEQVDLRTAFTQKSGRKTIDMQGVPPTSQGLAVMPPPPPVKKVLHSRER